MRALSVVIVMVMGCNSAPSSPGIPAEPATPGGASSAAAPSTAMSDADVAPGGVPVAASKSAAGALETAQETAADPFVQVAISHLTTCAVRKSGSLWCFRDADPILRPVAGFTDVAQVAVHADGWGCAARRDGTFRCFDVVPDRKDKMVTTSLPIDDAIGVVERAYDVCAVRRGGKTLCFHPFATAAKPQPGEYPGGIRQLAFGENHTCAVLADRGVRCWGSNGRGQLGRSAKSGMTGDAEDVVPDGPAGGVRAEVRNVTAVAAGSEHTCAIVAGGKVTCWGTHYQGALGVGAKVPPVGKPVSVPGVDGAVEIESNGWTTCVRRGNGAVQCWGANRHGQIGDGTLGDRLTPVTVPEIRATDLAMAQYRTCATLTDGRIACWGSSERAPTKLALADVTALAGSREATCARKQDGTTWCWGRLGVLRDNAFAAHPAPVHMRELDALRTLGVRSGEWEWEVCGATDSDVACWTHTKDAGDVVDLAKSPRSLVPVGLGNTGELSKSDAMTCALLVSGSVRCFTRSSPNGRDYQWMIVPVPALDGSTHVFTHREGVCGIGKDGSVRCVGSRHSGLEAKLGGKAVVVPGVKDAVALSGDATGPICALQSSGAITCFRYDEQDEKVGDVKTIAGIDDAVSTTETCAVRKTGEVACFDPSQRDGAKVTPVAGIRDGARIVGGWKHRCVLHRDRTVSCWGENQYGQVGDATGAGAIWTVPVAKDGG